MSRPDWDEYFLQFARVASTRATCDRLKVGAVIVVDRQIVSTGYNGSVRGMPHCDEVGHDMVNDHCVRTIHAEMNAIAQAARRGIAVEGSSIYVTANPCWLCFRVLVNAGITSFVFEKCYRELEDRDRILEVVSTLGLEVRLSVLEKPKPVDPHFRKMGMLCSACLGPMRLHGDAGWLSCQACGKIIQIEPA